jgi:DNA-binding MarR family transcriptional regulator
MGKVELERIDFLFSQILHKIFLYPGKKTIVHDVTFPQMKVLWLLSVMPECKMTDLANNLSVTLPTATSIIDTLVRKDLVKRLGVKGDRRMVALMLSRRGGSIVEAHKRYRRGQLEGVFSRLSHADQKEFLRSLERIYTVLEKTDRFGER